MKEFTIPVGLKNAICNNQLVLFVGAGLSFNMMNIKNQKIEGWSNLVEQILKDLKNSGYEVDDLIPLLKRYEPIKILDLIESDKAIPKSHINNFVKDFFDLDEKNNNFELHEMLFKLSNKIITTNYDSAFEKIVPELRKNKAYTGKNYELTTDIHSTSPILFKLHGCFEDAGSMVLFPSNYRELYKSSERDAKHSIKRFENIILNKTILFIGTGMGDFQINNLFAEIARLKGEFNQPHYIITSKQLDSSLSFLSPLTIKERSETNTIINQLLAIKESCESDESDEVKQLREQLRETRIELESLKSEDLSNKDKLLEREALKYFSRGVELQLLEKYEDANIEYSTALELKADLHEALSNWGSALGNLADTKQGKEAEDLYQQAFEKYDKALEIKPDKHEAIYNWGIELGNLADTKEGKEAENLYHRAFEKYGKALEIKSDLHEALSNWGIALGNLAKIKKGKEAEDLYHRAFEKYHKVLKIKPDKHETLFNWGIALGNLAKTKKGKEAEDLYQQAFEKYDKTLKIKPDKHEALYNWGTDLGDLAKTKRGKEAEDLYQQAFEKYSKALEVKPDKHEALLNWGTDLGNLAKIKQGKEADGLYLQAFEKYDKAVEIKPDKHGALYNWGNTLMHLAKTKQGKEAEDLYAQAFEKLNRAFELGGSCYNLSCLYALKKEKTDALKYLNMALSNNDIDAKFVLQDEDWKEYLNDEDFKTLLRKFNKN